MTSEEQGPTEAWVKKHRIRYAYAYDRGLTEAFHVRALPYAILVDTQGVILWKGHPAALGPELIELAVRGALEVPLYRWPEEALAAKEALALGKYARALAQCKGFDPRFEAMVKKRIEHGLASMRRAKKRGDYLLARDLAERAKRQLRRLPQQAEAIALLAELKSTPAMARVVAAQESLRALALGGEAAGTREALHAVLAKIKDLQLANRANIVGQHAKREFAVLAQRLQGLR